MLAPHGEMMERRVYHQEIMNCCSSDNREDEGPDNDAHEKLHNRESRYCHSRCMATICIQPTCTCISLP